MALQNQARIDEDGRVTLPEEIRRKLGLKKGDVVAISETEDGVLIVPRQVVVARALDEIGRILNEEGFSLEDLIEAGRVERATILDSEDRNEEP